MIRLIRSRPNIGRMKTIASKIIGL
jgi:hypothetical protein